MNEIDEQNQSNQQLPGESDKAYHAFRSYLALGAHRSLSTLARQPGFDRSSIEKWSKQWKWVERARTHTQRLSQIQDVAVAEALQDAAEKWVRRGEQLKELEWNITLRLLDRAGEILQTPEADPSTRDACLAVELASRIGRLASDLANRNNDPPPASNDLPTLFAATLEKVYGTPPPTPDSNPNLNPNPNLNLAGAH